MEGKKATLNIMENSFLSYDICDVYVRGFAASRSEAQHKQYWYLRSFWVETNHTHVLEGK